MLTFCSIPQRHLQRNFHSVDSSVACGSCSIAALALAATWLRLLGPTPEIEAYRAAYYLPPNNQLYAPMRLMYVA